MRSKLKYLFLLKIKKSHFFKLTIPIILNSLLGLVYILNLIKFFNLTTVEYFQL
jgi:hypothetical protein